MWPGPRARRSCARHRRRRRFASITLDYVATWRWRRRSGGRPVHPPQYPCYGGRATRNGVGECEGSGEFQADWFCRAGFRRARRRGSTAGGTPAATWDGDQTPLPSGARCTCPEAVVGPAVYSLNGNHRYPKPTGKENDQLRRVRARRSGYGAKSSPSVSKTVFVVSELSLPRRFTRRDLSTARI